MPKTVFIFHGTEGYPEENWFPWLKGRLEERGHRVVVPQFPTLPIVPAILSEWFEVLEGCGCPVDEHAVLVGHSLGGLFALRVLEKSKCQVSASFYVGTPIGTMPIDSFKRVEAFSGFAFDWDTIRRKAGKTAVFQSDNDPYVGQGNGEELARRLGAELMLVPGAGHFNTAAGYREFPVLFEKILSLTD